MPELSVPEAQLERLEEVRTDLEAAYVGEYGTVRQADALEYLLDTYTPPDEGADAGASADPAPDLEALTGIDGVGEATAESLAAAGFPTVADVAAADPESLAEIGGIGREQAVDIAASAAAIDGGGEAGGRSGDDPADSETADGGAAPGEGASDSPEDTLQRAMSLLDAHEDRWREGDDDTPYEVDLPDGSTEGVRTKDGVKRLLFKHWR